MSIGMMLLPEFEEEMKLTRKALAALPEGKGEYKVHAKSMSLTGLGGHLAEMPGFMSVILTSAGLDLAAGTMVPLKFTGLDQVLGAFDGMAAQGEKDLAAVTDEQMESEWKLTYGEHTIFAGTRYMAYRTFGMNHMIHHRAQLGVNLRLMEIAVPTVYGPSADHAA